MAAAASYFYVEPSLTREAIAQHVGDAARPALLELEESFAAMPWQRETIAAALKEAAARHGLKAPQVMMPLRYLVAGTPTTPALDAVLALLGREKVRARRRRRACALGIASARAVMRLDGTRGLCRDACSGKLAISRTCRP